MPRATKIDRKSSRPTAQTLLAQLAEVIGIESEFKDARGKLQRTSAETKSALLAAMGVRAATPVEVEESLHAIERAEWSRVLQPVYVIQSNSGKVCVPVTTAEGTAELAWQLVLEQGEEKSEKVAVNELPLIEMREIGGSKYARRMLALGKDISHGYHRLRVNAGGSEATLIVAPEQCWLPDEMNEEGKIWGIAAQLYTLTSERNWGIGDFSDLRQLVSSSAAAGADIVGLNPLHALFPDNPDHASPYSPSSRLLLNVLYIDVPAAPGYSDCEEARKIFEEDEFQKQLRECRAAPLVDYPRVTDLKLRLLRPVFKHWNTIRSGSHDAFERFVRDQADRLQLSCAFHCLRQKFASHDFALCDWRSWPEEYRDPASEAVRRFMEENSEEILFAAWLQWVADEQLGTAAQAASSMAIGLYRDLAVGADPSGTETWLNQKAVVSGAHIGAPPDIFNPAGQDWGLPPFHPRALGEQQYGSFIELIRANMRYAGALRVDHVMALQHLYLIPEGRGAQDGAYVRYPMEDLIGILALESQRNRCMVVGEDLGTVPDGFRERMERANILSYRVLFFEQASKTGVFRKPKDYPRLAVAVASNHDLPTIPAWWLSLDVELRDRLKLYPDAKEAGYQATLRQRDRNQLKGALEKQHMLEKSGEPTMEELVSLVYEYLARSNSFAALVQLDDVTGEVDPVNLPGSTEQYPNWRRKLSVPLEELFEKPLARQVVDVFHEERGTVRPALEKTTQ